MKMVFDEFYGEIPVTLRSAIRRYNVSPSDWYVIEDLFKGQKRTDELWASIKAHIVTHSMPGGMYRF